MTGNTHFDKLFDDFIFDAIDCVVTFEYTLCFDDFVENIYLQRKLRRAKFKSAFDKLEANGLTSQ